MRNVLKKNAHLCVILFLATALGLTGCDQEENKGSQSGSRVRSNEQTTSNSAGASGTIASPQSTSPSTTEVVGDLVDVVSVTDGDTIKVRIGADVKTIRFIGIDTPETRDPRKPVQCFGREASSKMKELVENKQVFLEVDPSQGDTDKYGRLLRFIFLPDGTNVNLAMITEGFAHEYTYNLPYKYQDEFIQAENDARDNDRGLWSPSTCNGDTKQSAS